MVIYRFYWLMTRPIMPASIWNSPPPPPYKLFCLFASAKRIKANHEDVCRNTFSDDQLVITMGLQNEKSEYFVKHGQTSKHSSWLWIHSIEIGTTKEYNYMSKRLLWWKNLITRIHCKSFFISIVVQFDFMIV